MKGYIEQRIAAWTSWGYARHQAEAAVNRELYEDNRCQHCGERNR